MIAGILLGIVSGLLANEFCEFSPWCARKLVRWSAFRRYTDPGRAEMRADEWTAVINDRPGNLFKLITAVGFTATAVIVSGRRAVARESDVGPGSSPALPAFSHAEALPKSSMTCMSCGEAILASEASKPCHNCGSVDRRVSLADHATATDAITAIRFYPSTLAAAVASDVGRGGGPTSAPGHAAWRLAGLSADRGDLDELRARADVGDEDVAGQLVGLLIKQGRGAEAEQLRRFGLNPDGSIACA